MSCSHPVVELILLFMVGESHEQRRQEREDEAESEPGQIDVRVADEILDLLVNV